MVSGQSGTVNRELDLVFQQGTVAGLSEAQLIGQFVARRDEVAFEALLTRHGPMVLGVCRRMLGDPHDAADAFQTTFLILVRKAWALRDPEQVGPWLHGVAYKVAARALSDSAKRRNREQRGARAEAFHDRPAHDRPELRGILDQELNRLPEKYRRPIILCYLEGRTHEEAARRLRCTAGMLRGRLDRGRAKLRSRLASRGLAPAVTLTAAALAGEAVAAPVPEALKETTRLAALGSLNGGAAPTAISALALSLAQRVVRSALISKLAFGATILVLGIAVLATLPLATTEKAGSHGDRPDSPPAASASRAQPLDGITLTGRVVDRAGRAIPGARVARETNRQVRVPFENVTDDEGRFTFTRLAPGPVILTVQATGYAPDLKEVTAAAGMAPVEFRLGPRRSIGGRITDLAGKPIAGTPISAGTWRGHNTLVWQAVTDSDGRYRWNDAPEDEVQIDLGTMGYTSKRFLVFPRGQVTRDLTMPRPRYVRGSVTDAVTGKPIERFTVLTGYGAPGGRRLDWEYRTAVPGSAGTYEAKLGAEYRNFDRYVRIEADGYVPQRSRALGESEPEWDRTIDFKLQPGEATITGVVRRSDGSPLVGADVVLVTSLTLIANGRFPDPPPGRESRTGPDGRFRFPSVDPPFTVVVLHDTGFAQRTSEEFASGPDMTIKPWGRIEGTYHVGSRPGTGESLTFTRNDKDLSKALIQFTGRATVDTDGHFVFERVHDGPISVARQVKQGPFTSVYPLSDPLNVSPGDTVRVAIGGTGRPVIGQLDIPARIAGQVDWTSSEIHLVSDRRPQRIYVGEHTLSGGFRIEDVPAGDYTLAVNIKKSPSNAGNVFSDPPIAIVRHRLTVAPIPGGRSDEPLDVGAFAVSPSN